MCTFHHITGGLKKYLASKISPYLRLENMLKIFNYPVNNKPWNSYGSINIWHKITPDIDNSTDFSNKQLLKSINAQLKSKYNSWIINQQSSSSTDVGCGTRD